MDVVERIIFKMELREITLKYWTEFIQLLKGLSLGLL
jgi:hypothetical protein